MSHGFWVVLVYLVMGQWAVGQWIVGDISFHEILKSPSTFLACTSYTVRRQRRWTGVFQEVLANLKTNRKVIAP